MDGRDSAEALALRALTWIAGQEDVLGDFLAATGADPADLAAGAGRAEFLAAVLDFLLLEDRWVMGFCNAEGLGYEAPMKARAALPGGEAHNWT